MTDKKILRRCQEKIQQTLDNFERREARFKAYCEFYRLGDGRHAEQLELNHILQETLQPIKDIYIIYALLDEAERKEMPALDEHDLSERKRKYHIQYRKTIIAQQSNHKRSQKKKGEIL